MTPRRSIAFGAAWLMAASSLTAAITVVQWKPGTGNQYLRICWADALVDLPGAPPEGSMCSVEATNSTYVYHDGSWAALGGGGGITLGTSYGAGALSAVLYRTLITLPNNVAYSPAPVVLPPPGIRVYPNSCIWLILRGTATAATVAGSYTILER